MNSSCLASTDYFSLWSNRNIRGVPLKFISRQPADIQFGMVWSGSVSLKTPAWEFYQFKDLRSRVNFGSAQAPFANVSCDLDQSLSKPSGILHVKNTWVNAPLKFFLADWISLNICLPRAFLSSWGRGICPINLPKSGRLLIIPTPSSECSAWCVPLRRTASFREQPWRWY